MALKVELKPGERFILGDSVITNDDQRTKLFIEGTVPILRSKDILRMEDADTPCKKIYLVVQMMYLAKDPKLHHSTYFKLIGEVQNAAPSLFPHIDRLNNEILTGAYYKGLRIVKAMISDEEELLNNALGRTGI